MSIVWDTSQIDRALVRLANADLATIPIAGGFTMAGIMAENAPYLTGNLRRSLHPEGVGSWSGPQGDPSADAEHVESVDEQPGMITVEVGTNLEYAPDTEFRSRRPGWAAKSLREGQQPVEEDMAEAARQVIEQAARG